MWKSEATHKGNGVTIEINANVVWLIPCVNVIRLCVPKLCW